MSPTPFNRSMFRDRASGGFATPGRPSMGFSGMSQPAQLGVAQGGGGIQSQLQSTMGGLDSLNDRISSYADNVSQEANQLASMTSSMIGGGGGGMSQQGFRGMQPGPLAPYMRQVLQQQMEAQRSNPGATGNMLGLAEGGEAKRSSFPEMQAGGMMPPVPEEEMPWMATEEEAMIYQEAQNLPPEVLQAADQELSTVTQELTNEGVAAGVNEEVSRSIGNIDMAGDYRDLMNVVWEDNADIEAYRNRLADVVGWEDADRTPDSVLALVQPTLQLAEIDQGIGALMQEELAEVGELGGGIADLGSNETAVAEGMAAETNALVNAVSNMAPTDRPTVTDDMRMMAEMQGTGPMGQDIDPQVLESMMQGMA